MPNIGTENQPVHRSRIFESEPDKQTKALSVMTERVRFMARQPGFISISVHRSLDGRSIDDGRKRGVDLLTVALRSATAASPASVARCASCG